MATGTMVGLAETLHTDVHINPDALTAFGDDPEREAMEAAATMHRLLPEVGDAIAARMGSTIGRGTKSAIQEATGAESDFFNAYATLGAYAARKICEDVEARGGDKAAQERAVREMSVLTYCRTGTALGESGESVIEDGWGVKLADEIARARVERANLSTDSEQVGHLRAFFNRTVERYSRMRTGRKILLTAAVGVAAVGAAAATAPALGLAGVGGLFVGATQAARATIFAKLDGKSSAFRADDESARLLGKLRKRYDTNGKDRELTAEDFVQDFSNAAQRKVLLHRFRAISGALATFTGLVGAEHIVHFFERIADHTLFQPAFADATPKPVLTTSMTPSPDHTIIHSPSPSSSPSPSPSASPSAYHSPSPSPSPTETPIHIPHNLNGNHNHLPDADHHNHLHTIETPANTQPFEHIDARHYRLLHREWASGNAPNEMMHYVHTDKGTLIRLQNMAGHRVNVGGTWYADVRDIPNVKAMFTFDTPKGPQAIMLNFHHGEVLAPRGFTQHAAIVEALQQHNHHLTVISTVEGTGTNHVTGHAFNHMLTDETRIENTALPQLHDGQETIQPNVQVASMKVYDSFTHTFNGQHPVTAFDNYYDQAITKKTLLITTNKNGDPTFWARSGQTAWHKVVPNANNTVAHIMQTQASQHAVNNGPALPNLPPGQIPIDPSQQAAIMQLRYEFGHLHHFRHPSAAFERALAQITAKNKVVIATTPSGKPIFYATNQAGVWHRLAHNEMLRRLTAQAENDGYQLVSQTDALVA